jgi:L-ascorbate metabolism protein UlaG (beta-lactamase superfamily)
LGQYWFRIYGSDELFNQNFSSIAANRNSESLTNRQRNPSQQLGFAGQWRRTFSGKQTIVAGFEGRDVRGHSAETTFNSSRPTANVDAGGRQRALGFFGQDTVQFKKSWSPQHFSGRSLSDLDCTLWCGFVIQAAAGNIYFAGDTAMGEHFKQIKEQFGEFRLALLPIGAYLPGWFMHPVHLSPAEAVNIHYLLQPYASVAIHFGTFALGDDGEVEPVRELREALGNQISNFWILEHGEGRYVN